MLLHQPFRMKALCLWGTLCVALTVCMPCARGQVEDAATSASVALPGRAEESPQTTQTESVAWTDTTASTETFVSDGAVALDGSALAARLTALEAVLAGIAKRNEAIAAGNEALRQEFNQLVEKIAELRGAVEAYEARLAALDGHLEEVKQEHLSALESARDLHLESLKAAEAALLRARSDDDSRRQADFEASAKERQAAQDAAEEARRSAEHARKQFEEASAKFDRVVFWAFCIGAALAVLVPLLFSILLFSLRTPARELTLRTDEILRKQLAEATARSEERLREQETALFQKIAGHAEEEAGRRAADIEARLFQRIEQTRRASQSASDAAFALSPADVLNREPVVRNDELATTIGANEKVRLALERTRANPDLDAPETREALREALEAMPEPAERSAEEVFLEGCLRYMAKDMKGAEALWRRAQAAQAAFAQAHYHLGALLAAQGRQREAEGELVKALEARPRYALAFFQLGNIAVAAKRIDRAEAAYRKAVECDPNFARAYNHLGDLLVETGRRNEAEIAYRHAIAAEPFRAISHYNLSCLLALRGQKDEMLKELGKAIRHDQQYREKAVTDTDFVAFREDIEFRRMVYLEE